MINVMDVLGKQNQDPMASLHKGIVVDNNDPEHKCRVKIRVPGILDGDSLPWAIPNISSFMGDGNSDQVAIPEVGSVVTVEFLTRDPHFPFYTGRIHSLEVPDEFKVNYPNRYGFKDSTGTIFYVDKSTGEVLFQHMSGFKFSITKEGVWELTSPGNGTVNVKDILDLIAASQITMDTKLAKGTGDVQDSVRTMAADREIYNNHDHVGDSGGSTSTPNSKQ